MSGGVARNAGRTAFFQGAQVRHGSHLVGQDSRDAPAGWLTSGTLDNVGGFRETVPVPRGRRVGRGAAAARHGRVLLLPDVFGSTLRFGGAPSRPDVHQLIALSVRQALAPEACEDAQELTQSYAPLIDALAAGFGVDPVPYDSRRSPATVGATVARTLRARLDGAGPVHLVTHGAGALVALAARRAAPQTWGAMIRGGGRVVLLSPPLAGSWLAAARCSGRDELTAALALLEPGAEPADIGKTLAGWKALAELIPDDPAAVEFRRGLLPRSWSGVTAIYGSADRTVCGRSGDGFSTTTAGDGHVTFAAARIDGPPTWYTLVPHADLPGDGAVIPATTDLLGGRRPTSRVFTTPGGDEPRESPLPDPRGCTLTPTSAELVRPAWGGGRARTTGSEMLQVSVMHGDLRYAGAPVLVGTYDGTPLKGADSVLDRHLGGALGRRAGLGQHPGRAGTCEVFRRGTEPAAVVIGLGDAGDITPGRLAAGVTTGVFQLVMEVLDSDDTGTVGRLPVAAVLIGAGGVAPLAVSASVTAIVSGVCRANRRLADLAHPVTVDRLVLVELYEERAIEAIRAAAELPGVLGSDGSEIRVDRHLVDGRNGLPGEPSPMYSQGAWKTVRVVAANAAERAEGPGDAIGEDRLVELSFTSLGRAARAEQGVSTGQRELLDLLVAATIDRPDADPQLWNTLYELLVPNSLKRQGRHGENLMYVIDEHAAALPFEMLATRSHDQSPRPLGVEVGIVRRLETRTFREVGRAATGHRALVIGDPPAAGLTRLPEAAREARRVVDVLTGHGYQVTAVIGDENATGELAVDILNALFAGEYRIVHIAGHGNVSPDPTRSGVVIGTDTYLTALEIEKMMTTPDLVFLNCCHLAALRPRGPGPDGQRLEAVPPYRPDRLAAGISRQLVDNGVRAVVAAGWAVDDLAAADFAEILYDQLLRGSDLGEASLTARREVFDTHQDRRINTWGAYQVYGPPAFRIAEPTAAHHAERDPMARRELRDRLSALCERAEAGNDPDVADQLNRLLAAVPAEWLGAAELCAAGEVWTALGRYQRAVEAFDGARIAPDGDGSQRAVAQLVTILATWAAELGSVVPNGSVTTSDAPAAADLFADAERYARALIALGPTPQRWSLLAGVERRRAQCADPGALTGALERARDHYGAADALARSTGASTAVPRSTASSSTGSSRSARIAPPSTPTPPLRSSPTVWSPCVAGRARTSGPESCPPKRHSSRP